MPYQVKATEAPRAVEFRSGDEGGALAEAILGGLASDQEARPSAEELAGELVDWEEAHGTTRPWEHTLGEQMASDATAVPTSRTPVSPTMLRMSSAPSVGGRAALAGQSRAGFLRRHLRGVVACVIVACAVAGALFAGSQTHWFGIEAPLAKGSVNDYSRSELSHIAQRISAVPDGNEAARIEAEYHLVNDGGKLDFTQTKDVELADGTQTSAVIVGFRHDEKSDGSGKAGISFVFSEPVAVRPMGAKGEKARGWEGTDLRSWLSGDFQDELPDELRGELVEIRKTSVELAPSDGNGRSDIPGYDDKGGEAYYRVSAEETDDAVWVCSLAEQGGLLAGDYYADALELSSGQIKDAAYEIYSDRTLGAVATSDDVAELADAGDAEGATWLRTPSYEGSSSYDTTGGEGSAPCTESLGVVPGFCI